MIADIKKINEMLGITVLYVTNDFQEAVDLKEKIVFMKDGCITEIQPKGKNLTS